MGWQQAGQYAKTGLKVTIPMWGSNKEWDGVIRHSKFGASTPRGRPVTDPSQLLTNAR